MSFRAYCACPHCGNVFVLQKKPFKRFSVSKEEGVAVTLAGLVEVHNHYLCPACFEECMQRSKLAAEACRVPGIGGKR